MTLQGGRRACLSSPWKRAWHMLSNPYTIEKTGWVFPRVVVGGGICLWSYFSILPKTATINRYSQKQKDYNVLSLSLPTRDEWEEMELDALIRNEIYIFTSKDSKRLWCHTELGYRNHRMLFTEMVLSGQIWGHPMRVLRTIPFQMPEPSMGQPTWGAKLWVQSHALPLFECPGQACSFHT